MWRQFVVTSWNISVKEKKIHQQFTNFVSAKKSTKYNECSTYRRRKNCPRRNDELQCNVPTHPVLHFIKHTQVIFSYRLYHWENNFVQGWTEWSGKRTSSCRYCQQLNIVFLCTFGRLSIVIVNFENDEVAVDAKVVTCRMQMSLKYDRLGCIIMSL